MTGDDQVFSSVILCYFLDRGPTSIDFFVSEEITEDPDITAVRLMTKSTAMVKGDSSQQVEKSITKQLSGPDIYPVDPKYRMVWYNWLIGNRFSNDSRIKTTGGMGGIYCIYKKSKEDMVRTSLKTIEETLQNISNDFKTIDDLIKKKLGFKTSITITQAHFSDFIKEKDSNIITRSICVQLNENVKKNIDDQKHKYVSQTGKFKTILQSIIFKQGTLEEISGQTSKRKYWEGMIKNLDARITPKLPKLVLNKISIKNLKSIYHLLEKEKIWADLPLGEIPPSIQTREIGNFFFYYWLAHHNLLRKKEVLKFYQKNCM